MKTMTIVLRGSQSISLIGEEPRVRRRWGRLIISGIVDPQDYVRYLRASEVAAILVRPIIEEEAGQHAD